MTIMRSSDMILINAQSPRRGWIVICKSGRPTLGDDADRALFAESAGTCLLCNTTLFPKDPKRKRSIPIAERAHVIAHSDEGPRADPSVSQKLRDSPSNIILLCPTCHTKVDKDPEGYPTEDLLNAKRARAQAVSQIGGTPSFSSRVEARRAVERLLMRNRITFRENGPDPETGAVGSREQAEFWADCVLREIVPNNRLIGAIVDVNVELTTPSEREIAELLRQHTNALERKHMGEPILGPTPRFPRRAEDLFAEEDE
ncbi:5-methylcytosine-specific restriction endonuclease McrA [Streptomyces sp. PvR006]|uniref:HNH endonuclease n=1 Tax=Streptomyces sp. PvR006 TaxID=2817860 RepID=UPI0035ABD8BA|nr:5-methylcytosine-specific restriction endonuclease McrA [Streptomyces sp. PvR006]